jgi:hypothetical protein
MQAEFTYAVERRRVGAGRIVWHWEIRRRGETAPVITSVNLYSRAAAEQEAVRAINERCRTKTSLQPSAVAGLTGQR